VSAPGRRIGKGHLRVDARRAVAKLREYQLPDPNQWILEAARGAVGLGALSLDVQGDTDDVWLRWHGPQLEDDDLIGLLDELVSPSPTLERRPLRLLATGINTALALHPRWVDVCRFGEEETVRARYTEKLFDVQENDDASPAIAIEKVDAPVGATELGGAVHVRRRPDLAMVGRYLAGDDCPEVRLFDQLSRDPVVPTTVRQTTYRRETSRGDLLRVPMPGFDGFVALTNSISGLACRNNHPTTQPNIGVGSTKLLKRNIGIASCGDIGYGYAAPKKCLN